MLLSQNQPNFIMSVQASIQTDKPKKQQNNLPPIIPQYNQQDEQSRKKKIRQLTIQNKQLINTLKQQNQQLTKIIHKQKLNTHRSSSVKQEDNHSIKRQLNNVYKQIDMYKSVLQNMKGKEISTDSLDKINELQNKVKYEDNIIQELQKQLKYVTNIRDQQAKELKILSNEETKKSVADMELDVTNLKQRLKQGKKQMQKRIEIQKRYQNYQIQLEKTLRMINDDYYPGKVEKKEPKLSIDIYTEITEQKWQEAQNQFENIKKIHEQNSKKIEITIRQKQKQIKSFQDNNLIIKEKLKILQNLKNKINQLSKLIKTNHQDNKNQNDKTKKEKQQYDQTGQKVKLIKRKKSVEDTNNKLIEKQQRQIKKWMIPEAYYVQKGKIMPDSIFFTDKGVLKAYKKTKIIKIKVWVDSQNTPNLIQSIYQNQNELEIEGVQPIINIPNHLIQKNWEITAGDYLAKINGKFIDNLLVSITFRSKFGIQMVFQNESYNEGVAFRFQPRPNQIPSGFFGAYVNKNNGYALCHIGCQFIADW